MPMESLRNVIQDVVSRLPEKSEYRPPVKQHDVQTAFVETLPTRFAGCTFENYEITNPKQEHVIAILRKAVSEKASIVLIGPPGVGKDHLLIAAAKEFTRKHNLPAKRICGYELSIDDDLLRLCSKVSLLIASDPNANQMWFSLIDRRWSNRLPTWVAINANSRAEAIDKYGEAFVSRIEDEAYVCRCEWKSHRCARHIFKG